jgi:hypothetical protein
MTKDGSPMTRSIEIFPYLLQGRRLAVDLEPSITYLLGQLVKELPLLGLSFEQMNQATAPSIGKSVHLSRAQEKHERP